ncbi:MAG: RHS repeat-associated core domain-containing protein [Saprospirales bacterium]|nr:RHS repeat-associated core domain-containing protein [Saprospirales bacterium]
MVTTYEYDGGGNLIKVTTPENTAYLYEYDGENRLMKKTIPLQGEFKYEYYETGWLKKETIPEGHVYFYEYNPYGEMEKKWINDVLFIDITIGDTGINTGRVEEKSVGLTDGSGNIYYSYTYDQFGRVQTEAVVHNWGTDNYSYEWDNADLNRKTTRYSQAGGINIKAEDSFAYDQYGREISHHQVIGTQGSNLLISQTGYTDIDQVRLLKLGGIAGSPLQTVQYGYNVRDWITQINKECGQCVDEWLDHVNQYDGDVVEVSHVTIQYNATALLNVAPSHIRISLNREMIHEEEVVYSEAYEEIFPVNGPGGDSLFSTERTIQVNGPADPEVVAIELAEAMADETPGIPNMEGTTFISDLKTIRGVIITNVRDLYRRELEPDCGANEKDLFAEQIGYISPHPDMPNGESQYNGNITQVQWCIFGREGQELFGYAYDDLNRLTGAYYPESQENEEHDFDVSISYADKLGNIGRVIRRGLIGINDLDQSMIFGLMDDLGYTYDQGQLVSVTESASQDYGYLNAGTGFGYEYGKLVSAGGRGILSIEYNELNLPERIEMEDGTIDILYDAEGVKWYQKTIWTSDPPPQYPNGEEEKVYLRGLEVVNDIPAALYHPQGRAVLKETGELDRQEYFLRDHLGNTRVVFSDINGNGVLDYSPNSTEIIQTNTYYPFGMLIEGMSPVDASDPAQPYLYNGKEFNEDLNLNWYDYGARWYDPSIGRWNAVDPLAEKYASISPYAYVANNPLIFIDPDGRDIIVGGQVWTPGAQWQGDESDFGHQAFAALQSLYENIEAGNVSTSERTGNVIMDFVGENAIGDVSIVEAGENQGSFTSETGAQITWNSEMGIHVGPSKDGKNVEGDLSTTTLLAHEFGHAWLAQASPTKNAALERIDKNHGTTHEEDWVLENIETPFALARKEGVRSVYRPVYGSKSDFETPNRLSKKKPVFGDYFTKENDD